MTPMYKWSQLEAHYIPKGGQKEVQNRTITWGSSSLNECKN